MFLTRGEIHQEPLWKLWFQHLAGLVPVSALRVSLHLRGVELAWKGTPSQGEGLIHAALFPDSAARLHPAQLTRLARVQQCCLFTICLVAQIHDGCAADQISFLQKVCGPAAGGNVIQQQHLFNVYVHVGANEVNFTGTPLNVPQIWHDAASAPCEEAMCLHVPCLRGAALGLISFSL